MKKICTMVTILTCGLFVSACGKESLKVKDNQSTITTSKNSNNKSTSPKFSAIPKHTTKHKEAIMNFEQIQTGNYSSLSGDWQLIKATAKNGDITDSTQVELSITKNNLTDGQITMNAAGLNDNSGNHKLNYQKEQGTLVANLADDTSINYSIKFCPTGTTNEYNNGIRNLIVIWTSNNNYTEVFEQKASNTEDKASSDVNKRNNDLWNTDKDDKLESFISQWSKTMNQDYQKYDGTNELKVSTGMSYPSDLANETVKGQQASIGWSKDGKGSYEYNVVAIYNHNGTLPPLPNRITYCFAFHNGKPVVLVDQSRDGGGDFEETQNVKLNSGFNEIAKN